MQPWRCRVELDNEYKHSNRDGLSTTGFAIEEEYRFFKSGTALSTLICMVSLFSIRIKSSHDFELKKTTATHEFLDEVGPLFVTCMVLSSIVSFSSLFNLFHIHLFLLSERRHPLMPVCFTIPLQRILHWTQQRFSLLLLK
jgi:hypothetical protein